MKRQNRGKKSRNNTNDDKTKGFSIVRRVGSLVLHSYSVYPCAPHTVPEGGPEDGVGREMHFY